MRVVALGAAMIALLWGAVTLATPASRLLVYRGGGEGKVVFDGRTHASAGLVCNDCHLDLFATAKRGLITQDDHGKPRACFACHDGKRAFDTCESCHRKT
jgi:phosphate transport system substrate-binding protein